MSDPQYEKLGVFYLGTENRDVDGDGRADYMLLDSRDLVTHAMCVGMTGSGKTGLGICLLEEAAMDGIPAIVVDPKGDMGNLLLSFPDLLASDFEPWISLGEAEMAGMTVAELAEKKAATWRKGLADTMQDGDRIRAMRRNAEFALYTPGGQFGRPLSLEGLFQRPRDAVMSDPELLQEVVSTTATSLLHLVGIDADPVSSREHVFLSLLIRKAWSEGQHVTIPDLIRWIHQPPMKTVGVMDIDTYLPEKDRFNLALSFNNLVASPAFAAFMEGEPFDIPSLLYTPEGKPKISVLTISHLADAERMFFVTLLLNNIIAWMRAEQGTSSLRALFYMDEVFGYFPPVAKPPAKKPLLTLLKTARAYGLGIVLATQNPGDIDYKGLSNVGTWFVGRLTTKRDRMRLLEGMADESIEGGVNKQELESLIAGLEPRQFIWRSVRGGPPVLFKTRFCMSYLAGPLTREQIQRLTAPARERAEQSPPAKHAATPPAPTPPPEAVAAVPTAAPAPAPEPAAPMASADVVPKVPTGVSVSYLPGLPGDVYVPALFGRLTVYYIDEKKGVDHTDVVTKMTPIDDGVVAVDWDRDLEAAFDLDDLVAEPPPGARFTPLPDEASTKTTFNAWQRALVDNVWRDAGLTLKRHRRFKLIAGTDETDRDFLARVTQAAREERDEAVDDIEAKYEKKRRSLEEKLAKAEERIERTKDQAKDAKRQTAISFGSAVLGSLLGKSLINQSTIYRSTTAAKSASRAKKSSSNVVRAEDSYERVEQQIEQLEADMKEDLEAVSERYDAAKDEIDTTEIRPLKRDVVVKAFALVWVPKRS